MGTTVIRQHYKHNFQTPRCPRDECRNVLTHDAQLDDDARCFSDPVLAPTTTIRKSPIQRVPTNQGGSNLLIDELLEALRTNDAQTISLQLSLMYASAHSKEAGELDTATGCYELMKETTVGIHVCDGSGCMYSSAFCFGIFARVDRLLHPALRAVRLCFRKRCCSHTMLLEASFSVSF